MAGDALARFAGMVTIERFCQTGSDPIGCGISDDHSHPGSRLKNCPMTAEKLEYGSKTKNLG
jgi:hypothetical protein